MRLMLFVKDIKRRDDVRKSVLDRELKGREMHEAAKKNEIKCVLWKKKTTRHSFKELCCANFHSLFDHRNLEYFISSENFDSISYFFLICRKGCFFRESTDLAK